MRSAKVILAVSAALLLCGCFAKQADLETVRREQRRIGALLADTSDKLERTRRGLDELRIRQEETRHPGGTGSAGMDRRLALLEIRIATLEAGGSGTSAIRRGYPTGGGLSGASAVKGTAAAAIAMESEESVLSTAPQDYRGGMERYREGQWDAAIERFRQFIQNSPRSELADNAQYWIGESYYNLGDYNRAIIELNEVLLKYPQGNRVPGALLALATAFADSNDRIDARLIVQKLISDHPESEEAKVGRQKLQDLAD